MGTMTSRSDLVPAFVRLCGDSEAEVRTAAANQVCQYFGVDHEHVAMDKYTGSLAVVVRIFFSVFLFHVSKSTYVFHWGTWGCLGGVVLRNVFVVVVEQKIACLLVRQRVGTHECERF